MGDTTTISDRASLPLPARHERGEGWGEGFVSVAATFFGWPSPLPSPHSFVVGRGNPLVAMVVVSRCARQSPPAEIKLAWEGFTPYCSSHRFGKLRDPWPPATKIRN